MDSERLPEELGLTHQDIENLSQRRLVRARPRKPLPRERMGYSTPADLCRKHC
jgi:hypothetical protein